MTDNRDSGSDSSDSGENVEVRVLTNMLRPIDNMGIGDDIPLIRPIPVRPPIPVRRPSPPRKRRSRNYGDKPKRTQGGRRKRRKKKSSKKRKKRTRRRRRKKGRKTKRKR